MVAGVAAVLERIVPIVPVRALIGARFNGSPPATQRACPADALRRRTFSEVGQRKQG